MANGPTLELRRVMRVCQEVQFMSKQIAKFVFLEGILIFLLDVWTAILVRMQILVMLVHAIHVLQVLQVPLLQVFATSALQVTLHAKNPKIFVKCVKKECILHLLVIVRFVQLGNFVQIPQQICYRAKNVRKTHFLPILASTKTYM